MRRFELYPIDTAGFFIKAEPLEGFCHSSIDRVACIALCHDDKVAIDFIFRIDGDPVARDRFAAGNDGNSRRHRATLLFEGLIIESQSGESRFNALSYQAADRHYTAVSRVTIEDDGNIHAVCDPLGKANALCQ